MWIGCNISDSPDGWRFPQGQELNPAPQLWHLLLLSFTAPSVCYTYAGRSLWPWQDISFSTRHINIPFHPSWKGAGWASGNVTFHPCQSKAFWVWICIFRGTFGLVVGSFHPRVSLDGDSEEISWFKTVTLSKALKTCLMNPSWIHASGTQDSPVLHDCVAMKISPEDTDLCSN